MTNEKKERGRRWLALVRGDGDWGSKAQFLREKGYTEGEVEELLAEEWGFRPLNCGQGS